MAIRENKKNTGYFTELSRKNRTACGHTKIEPDDPASEEDLLGQFMPGHQTFVIAGHAGAADDRAHRVNLTADMDAELAVERRTAIVLAPHAAEIGRDIFSGDTVQLLVRLQRKTRPVFGIAAAGATALAVEIIGGNGKGHAGRVAWN